jgi:AcrR family transcriptional regulator
MVIGHMKRQPLYFQPAPPAPASPSLDRRQRRSAETRERLFRSALELFATRGMDNTTVEDITEAADVGKGTFFNYFPSKEHILVAFSEMQLGKLQSLIDEIRGSREPISHFLHHLTLRMTAEPGRSPSVVRAMLSAYLATEPVRKALEAQYFRGEALLSELMQIGQERGEIRRDLTPVQLAQIFRQLVFGTLLMWSVDHQTPLAGRIQAALGALWGGIAVRNPAEPANVLEAGGSA